ncbi:hypothetical protein HGRIS_001013 [Hohenbuehelia grisea]|uniref:Uncharacterized protein n=1 Tax=Hohenbuehelia grisea TaxID=104357 RepID=A0ABR3IQG6_9AGAR
MKQFWKLAVDLRFTGSVARGLRMGHTTSDAAREPANMQTGGPSGSDTADDADSDDDGALEEEEGRNREIVMQILTD